MNKLELKTRRIRVKKINKILADLYPNPKISLNYISDWELLVAIMLSAQCTDKQVNETTTTLFKRYTNISMYADADIHDMESIIFSCGFYKNKAKNIIASAKKILYKYGGTVPDSMSELICLPGVARKTANVFLSNFYGINVGIAIDTHVRRFAIRFELTDFTDPMRIEKDLMQILPKNEWCFFNHRLVNYGRDYCPAKKHDCVSHPLTKVFNKANYIWPKAH